MKQTFISFILILGFTFGMNQSDHVFADQLVEEARSHLGVPYHFGGTSPSDGFDSSGFIQYVFNQASTVQLPRTVIHQWDIGENDC
jgi:cell wall-associated NlpC family hydrolase